MEEREIRVLRGKGQGEEEEHDRLLREEVRMERG